MIGSNVEKENFILRCFVKYIEENNTEGMENLKSFVPILNFFDSCIMVILGIGIRVSCLKNKQ